MEYETRGQGIPKQLMHIQSWKPSWNMSLRCACVIDKTAGLSRFPNYWTFDEMNSSVTAFNFCFYSDSY
jgi:hypothetical protein